MSVWTTAGLIADGTFDDPANARVIYLAVAGLVLLAVLLGVGTWLWWRSSKVENPVLAPLEVMSTRRWWKSDFNERQRRLDAVRPMADENDDADDAADAVPAAVPVDLDHVLVRDDPHTFDDLVDPDDVRASSDPADPVAIGVEAGETADAEESVATPEPVATAEPVAAPEVVAAADVADDAEADDAEADAQAVTPADAVAERQSEPEPAPEIATPEPVVRSIVIDTAPKPRDTPADLGPEAAEPEPAPAPIDPLLRLQAE